MLRRRRPAPSRAGSRPRPPTGNNREIERFSATYRSTTILGQLRRSIGAIRIELNHLVQKTAPVHQRLRPNTLVEAVRAGPLGIVKHAGQSISGHTAFV